MKKTQTQMTLRRNRNGTTDDMTQTNEQKGKRKWHARKLKRDYGESQTKSNVAAKTDYSRRWNVAV